MERMSAIATSCRPSSAATARAAAQQRHLAAQAVGAERDAEAGHRLADSVCDRDPGQQRPRGHDAPAQLRLSRLALREKGLGIAIKGLAALHRLDAGGQVLRRRHIDREAEAVEELRAQLALLRVAAADQHEAGGVADGEALALDHVLARGRDVEQQVDQMVLQQVDLVDIEEAAVGAGQKPRLESLLGAGQRPFDVERAGDAVLGRAERQVDDGRGASRVFSAFGPSIARSRQASQRAAGLPGSQL